VAARGLQGTTAVSSGFDCGGQAHKCSIYGKKGFDGGGERKKTMAG
jgi:hypothetical protein